MAVMSAALPATSEPCDVSTSASAFAPLSVSAQQLMHTSTAAASRIFFCSKAASRDSERACPGDCCLPAPSVPMPALTPALAPSRARCRWQAGSTLGNVPHARPRCANSAISSLGQVRNGRQWFDALAHLAGQSLATDRMPVLASSSATSPTVSCKCTVIGNSASSAMVAMRLRCHRPVITAHAESNIIFRHRSPTNFVAHRQGFGQILFGVYLREGENSGYSPHRRAHAGARAARATTMLIKYMSAKHVVLTGSFRREERAVIDT